MHQYQYPWDDWSENLPALGSGALAISRDVRSPGPKAEEAWRNGWLNGRGLINPLGLLVSVSIYIIYVYIVSSC